MTVVSSDAAEMKLHICDILFQSTEHKAGNSRANQPCDDIHERITNSCKYENAAVRSHQSTLKECGKESGYTGTYKCAGDDMKRIGCSQGASGGPSSSRPAHSGKARSGRPLWICKSPA